MGVSFRVMAKPFNGIIFDAPVNSCFWQAAERLVVYLALSVVETDLPRCFGAGISLASIVQGKTKWVAKQ